MTAAAEPQASTAPRVNSRAESTRSPLDHAPERFPFVSSTSACTHSDGRTSSSVMESHLRANEPSAEDPGDDAAFLAAHPRWHTILLTFCVRQYLDRGDPDVV